MAGKLCFGAQYNNAGPARAKESKAFCEGIEYRSSGTAILRPKATNPNLPGSPSALRWDAGWDLADASAGSALDPSTAPCCAISGVAVPV